MLKSMLARSASAGFVLIAVAVCALGPATPTATAQTPSAASSQLAEGVGMGQRPSVRVRRLQRVVDRAGFDVGPSGIDGRFGPFTAAAVRRMQRAYGLVPDGIVGQKTRRLVGLIADRQRARRSSRGTDTNRSRGQQTPTPTPAPSSSTPTPAPPATSPAPAPTSTAPAQTQPTQTQPTQTQPAQTQPAQTQPAQTQPAPAPAPANQPTAADSTPAAAESNGSEPLLMGALGAVAGALLALLALRFVRKDRSPDLVPIGRDLYLEGESDDEQVGTFSGHALATALPGRRGASEARFLIDDPRKPAPVWVRSSELRRSPRDVAPGEPVIGYASGDKRSSVSREVLELIQTACDEAGWDLLEIVQDDETDDLLSRRGLAYALGEIAEGRARGLVVGDVSRLAPSLADVATLVEWFRDADAALVIPDLELNTATAEGDRMASVLMTLSQWQRERTRRSGGALRAVKGPGRTRGSS
jgi:peptidoglycan hydrolase-like protein with peptidoglycan-binding domain